MAGLVDSPGLQSGFYQRMYVIFKADAPEPPSEHRLGYIEVKLAPTANGM